MITKETDISLKIKTKMPKQSQDRLDCLKTVLRQFPHLGG